jgi:hypothetical protein
MFHFYRRKLNTKMIIAKVKVSEGDEARSEEKVDDESHTSGNISNDISLVDENGDNQSTDEASIDESHNKISSNTGNRLEILQSQTSTLNTPSTSNVETLSSQPNGNKENENPSNSNKTVSNANNNHYQVIAAVAGSKVVSALSVADQSFIKEFVKSQQCGISCNDVECVVRALRSYECRVPSHQC